MSPLARLERQLCAAVVMDKPRVPEAGQLLWSWFAALHSARSYGFGPNPISHADMKALASMSRIRLRPDHIAILKAMDAAWLASARQSTGTAGKSAPAPAQPVTPEMFDAMFG